MTKLKPFLNVFIDEKPPQIKTNCNATQKIDTIFSPFDRVLFVSKQNKLQKNFQRKDLALPFLMRSLRRFQSFRFRKSQAILTK